MAKAGADVNLQNTLEIYSECHATPLHEAVFSIDKDITLFLIENGADITATGKDGKTPLECAKHRYRVIERGELKPDIQELIDLLTEYEKKRS